MPSRRLLLVLARHATAGAGGLTLQCASTAACFAWWPIRGSIVSCQQAAAWPSGAPLHHNQWRNIHVSSRPAGPEVAASAAEPPLAAAGPNPSLGLVRGGYQVHHFPQERVRNFGIIAHVDHGKSTLADRLMQVTGAISAGSQAQYLDKLQVERERGITVKAQTASLVHRHTDGRDYLLNLIDTPGHVDFSYEVSRSLAACQGALLLVDASQGIQAQTVANFFLAFEQGLALVPVVNKVDLPSSDVAMVAAQMRSAFDLDPAELLPVSAKTGVGVAGVLEAVIERIPAPSGDPAAPLRLLLFDAVHDDYRGVVCLVEVVDGQLVQGDKLRSMATGQEYEALEVGLLTPEAHPTGALLTGQVGYLICGLKNVKAARVGDTWHRVRKPVAALPGFKPAKAMVFAGLYPVSGDEYETLAAALDKLTLNDASVSVKKEHSDALGAGFRCGFLGVLHLEVFMQRLEQEFGTQVITTAPTVPYQIDLQAGESRTIDSASDYPQHTKVLAVREPTVLATIVAPSECAGAIMTLASGRRGEQLEYSYLGAGGAVASSSGGGGSSSGGSGSGSVGSRSDELSGSADAGGTGPGAMGDRVVLKYQLPLAELASDFYSRLKSVTHGYSSLDYEEGPYRQADLQRLDVLVNGQAVDALARMVHRADAERTGRALIGKLSELLDRQQFDVVLQAAANGRIIAREQLKAMRKNVLAKCYGGDVTRKRKLLEKQKEGKKRMRQLGAVSVPTDVFPELMKAGMRR